MSNVDLYFQTASREDFLADLLALQLAQEIPTPHGEGTRTVPVAGVDLDYVGPLVQTPAEYVGTFPPVETTPAVMFPGERANLRLTGPDAESRATTIAAASMAHTTLLAPEDVPASQIRWAGGGEPWTGQASVPPPPPSPDPEALPAAKTRLLARLAHRRWQVETGGIVLDGVPIRTDRESTALLSGAITFCDLESGAVVRWKTADGQFYELGETALRAIALYVGRHVQACFALEADLAGQIQAAETPETLTGLAAQIEAFSPVVL